MSKALKGATKDIAAIASAAIAKAAAKPLEVVMPDSDNPDWPKQPRLRLVDSPVRNSVFCLLKPEPGVEWKDLTIEERSAVCKRSIEVGPKLPRYVPKGSGWGVFNPKAGVLGSSTCSESNGEVKMLDKSEGAVESTGAEPPTVDLKAEERYQGQYGKGMAERNAGQAAAKFSKDRPDFDWQVVQSTADPDKFDVTGKKKSKSAMAAAARQMQKDSAKAEAAAKSAAKKPAKKPAKKTAEPAKPAAKGKAAAKPAEAAKTAQKGKGIGAFCEELLAKSKSTEEILKAVKAKWPDAKTSAASIAWYRGKMKEEGTLPKA